MIDDVLAMMHWKCIAVQVFIGATNDIKFNEFGFVGVLNYVYNDVVFWSL